MTKACVAGHRLSKACVRSAEICSHFGLRTADPSPLANPPTEHPTTAMADLVEPTRPQNAYWLWLRENRNALAEEAGTGNFSVVGKLAGEKWKAMKDALPKSRIDSPKRLSRYS